MRAQISKYWEAIRSSYWFVPSLMALGAVLLSLITTFVDGRFGDNVGGLVWLSFNTADGARSLLSTIAGSMITVAGVAFSITIAAVAYATSQLGPHLLGKFMRDTSNQVTLGTFIATFVYCLLVLRTVQGVDAGPGGPEAFVPHLGVFVALVLTGLSLGNLIYFIHHVPMSIHASQVVADIGRDLSRKTETLFPETYRRHELAVERDLASLGKAVALKAGSGGFVTHIDVGSLIDIAVEHDRILRVLRGPGDFVNEGEALVAIHGGEIESKAAIIAIHYAIVIKTERSPTQDTLFLIRQLAEIASRALSPGVNDPYTAINAVEWLANALAALGRRPIPNGFLADGKGELRVVTPSPEFDDFVAAMFDALRPYIGDDRNASLHVMGVLARLVSTLEHPPYRALLMAQATALKEEALPRLGTSRDREALDRAFREVVEAAGVDGTSRA